MFIPFALLFLLDGCSKCYSWFGHRTLQLLSVEFLLLLSTQVLYIRNNYHWSRKCSYFTTKFNADRPRTNCESILGQKLELVEVINEKVQLFAVWNSEYVWIFQRKVNGFQMSVPKCQKLFPLICILYCCIKYSGRSTGTNYTKLASGHTKHERIVKCNPLFNISLKAEITTKLYKWKMLATRSSILRINLLIRRDNLLPCVDYCWEKV